MIESRQAELDALYSETFPTPALSVVPATFSPALTDARVLEAANSARNGGKFRALYGGDAGGYTSGSEADQALVSLLAFYTQDPAQLDRLYRGSGLSREKWDRQDYRDRTIAKALEGGGETYSPPTPPVKRHGTPAAGAAPASLLRVESSAEWRAKIGQRQPSIIPGVLAAGGLAMLASDPKAGKTMLAIDLALSVANGLPFMGVYPVEM